MIDLDIQFEDNQIIVINKPANLLTIPDRYNKELPSLNIILKSIYKEIYVVHRLDYGTSGIILFAKTSEAHKFLSEQLNQRKINKIYSVILEGILPQDTLKIDIPLLPNPKGKGGVIPSIRGKEAISIFTVEKKYTIATLVSVQLLTGRLHQIRAHSAAVGYPLLVDELYGNNKEFYISTIKKRFNLKKGSEEHPIISRPTLHSKKVIFTHPAKGEMTIEADYPKDFKATLQVLDKYALIK